MASSKEYLHFILEQLSNLDDIAYRPMMGEYIIYYRGKIVGGIYVFGIARLSFLKKHINMLRNKNLIVFASVRRLLKRKLCRRSKPGI